MDKSDGARSVLSCNVALGAALFLVADTTVEVAKLVLETLKQNPAYVGWALVAFFIIVGLLLRLSFWKPAEIIKAWWEQRADKRLASANDTVSELTENLTLLRMTLDVARDSAERANRLRQASDDPERLWAVLHV